MPIKDITIPTIARREGFSLKKYTKNKRRENGRSIN
jgi:hypothetical protein